MRREFKLGIGIGAFAVAVGLGYVGLRDKDDKQADTPGPVASEDTSKKAETSDNTPTAATPANGTNARRPIALPDRNRATPGPRTLKDGTVGQDASPSPPTADRTPLRPYQPGTGNRPLPTSSLRPSDEHADPMGGAVARGLNSPLPSAQSRPAGGYGISTRQPGSVGDDTLADGLDNASGRPFVHHAPATSRPALAWTEDRRPLTGNAPITAGTRTPGAATAPDTAKTVAMGVAKPAQDSPAAAPMQTHVLKAGETFSSLAVRYLGHAKYVDLVARANPDLDPRRLKVGASIKIPKAPEDSIAALTPKPTAATKPAAAVTPAGSPVAAARTRTAAPDPKRTYTVKPGQGWYDIARDTLGNGDRWTELYELNIERVPRDPGKLRAGTVIELLADGKSTKPN